MLKQNRFGSHRQKLSHLDLHPNHPYRGQVMHWNDLMDQDQNELPNRLAYHLQMKDRADELQNHPSYTCRNHRVMDRFLATNLHQQLR